MAEAKHVENRKAGPAPWRVIQTLGGLAALLLFKLLMPRTVEPGPRPVMAATDGQRHEHPEVAFEPSDWSVGPIALIYVGVLILLVISCFVLIAAYPTAVPDVSRNLRIEPPGPRLQTDPANDLQRFRAEEDRRLNTYYWIDQQKATVHIPIDQAMQKLANTGLPGFPKGQQ